MTALLALTVCANLLAAAPKAPAVTLSPPAVLVELDTRNLNSQPLRLSWSPDATKLYLRVDRVDLFFDPDPRHYVVALDTRRLNAIDGEPGWAGEYWTWKSAQTSPAVPGLTIASTSREDQLTELPVSEELSTTVGGSQGTLPKKVTSLTVYALTLRGVIIGQQTGRPLPAGLTFGWAPAPIEAIAFANERGRIVVMDPQGRRQELKDSKDALLPAWSPDGRLLAFLQRAGRSRFTLKIAQVVGAGR